MLVPCSLSGIPVLLVFVTSVKHVKGLRFVFVGIGFMMNAKMAVSLLCTPLVFRESWG